tara:strand:- start:268 stop:417 length:150 start_codon:yes stop_codon:yes gene_type:complete
VLSRKGWAALASEKHLVMDMAVSAVAAVVGSGAVDFHVSLSAMDVGLGP